MKKIFITGSSDGIGLYVAKMLIKQGHEVIFHAKDITRAKHIYKEMGKVKVIVGDLSDFEEIKSLAKEVNNLGNLDTIIHNAGLFHTSNESIFKVNVLAPYMLTVLINRPQRLIYIGSNMHPQGKINILNLSLEIGVDYSTSKLYILMLSLFFARKWKDVYVNVVDPGWVRTKMSNYNAPDSLEDGSATQVWLATNSDAKMSGKYFYHLQETLYSSKANDIKAQEELIKLCEKSTGVIF
ncbi:SDR family NAD(P)-dependent oxidoreductase [Arcobacter sp. KX21116]|jgi:NAD(P)-dependent dehydrogenase (short-subunit alcohol dehydrogenase family)|tara:strand:- start:1685 stop:2401 length:717 start_codon:yes stop_codon:yes gene_type:complete